MTKVDLDRQLQALLVALTNANRAAAPAPPEQPLPQALLPVGGFLWANGVCRSLPEDYQIPTCSVQSIWMLWWSGDRTQNLPPLCRVFPMDFNVANSRKRYSDVRGLLAAMKEIGERLGDWTDPSTPEAVAQAFQCVYPPFLRELQDRRMISRPNELKWSTAFKIWRQLRAAAD